jgi:guanylate kinase
VQKRLADISTSVFITTPTLKELERRLKARGTDSHEIIDKRIEMAKREVQRICEYDYLIINDDLNSAAKVLVAIAKAARMKIPSIAINEFVLTWEKS